MGILVGFVSFIVVAVIVFIILILVNPGIFTKQNSLKAQKNEPKKSFLAQGSRDEMQEIAPSSIVYSSESEIKVENNYQRGFVVNGYPARVSINWMDDIYSYDGDMDAALHIEPANERNALDELTAKITEYEAQYLAELDKGSIKHITALRSKIDILMQQRSKLEQNFENLFHVTTLCSLYKDDVKELNKASQMFQSSLSGSRMNVMPLDLRQDDAFKSCSPFGLLSVPDYQRNMNTGALGTMFPFYNADISDNKGTFLGYDDFGRLIIVDLFNRRALGGNANFSLMGCSGSGKTYLTTLIINRSVLEGVKHCIIDPENEYGPCVEPFKGITVRISPNSTSRMNPFDIDEEIITDDYGNDTGKRFVDIKGKVAELLNLFAVMIPEYMKDAEIKSEISTVLLDMYHDFGFTEAPESLYENSERFNPETGEYVRGVVYKTMPTMSDFRNRLYARQQDTGNLRLESVVNALAMYCKGGTFDLFDCHSSINLSDFDKVPVFRFDVSELEEDILRPIGMHIVLTWAWNKYMKKDVKTKKRIVCDEAWMLLNSAMAGSDKTAHFLETAARRARKYNGSLGTVSQQFREFVGRPEGLAILSNSAVRIFMRQEPEDIQAVGDRFILSDGEKQFLLTAGRGRFLLKANSNSIVGNTFAFPFEHNMIARE